MIDENLTGTYTLGVSGTESNGNGRSTSPPPDFQNREPHHQIQFSAVLNNNSTSLCEVR